MTIPDTLAVARARLAEITRQLAHLMAEVGGVVRVIDDIDDTAGMPGPSPTVGRGVYRGIAGAYWQKGIAGTDGQDLDEAYRTEDRRKDNG